MRISVDPSDPGYSHKQPYPNLKVMFNGVERKGVVIADEEEGLIVCYVIDEFGKYKLHTNGSGLREVLREVLYGNVYIDAPDEFKEAHAELVRHPQIPLDF